jgi:hypothetical protein
MTSLLTKLEVAERVLFNRVKYSVARFSFLMGLTKAVTALVKKGSASYGGTGHREQIDEGPVNEAQ